MLSGFLIKTNYKEESVELAYRDGSVEENRSSVDYDIARLYTSGNIVIVSSPSWEAEKLVERASRLAEYFRINGESDLFEKDFYKGSVSFNKPVSLDEALELIKKICSELRSKGLGCEAVFINRRWRIRHVIDDYGIEAEEDRWLNELYIYSYAIHMGQLLSTGINYVFIDRLMDVSEESSQGIYYSLLKQARAKRFNPIYSGSWIVVLKKNAACALYHELAHLLEADEPIKLGLNAKISDMIKMYEDPFYPGPLRRLFDDEVYPAWRRMLIDDGLVVDYLRNRLCSDDSKPGNGRGLFVKPKAMYHQLIVKSGDWGSDEIEDEFKRFIVVEEIVKAEVYDGLIKLLPEMGVLKDKDKVQPIKHFELALPINQLDRSIIGLGEEIYTRFSYEKNQPIYEVTPLSIIEMRVRP